MLTGLASLGGNCATHSLPCQLALPRTRLTGLKVREGSGTVSASSGRCNSACIWQSTPADSRRGSGTGAVPGVGHRWRRLACTASTAAVASLAALEERVDTETDQQQLFDPDDEHSPASIEQLLHLQRATQQLRHFLESNVAAHQHSAALGPDHSTAENAEMLEKAWRSDATEPSLHRGSDFIGQNVEDRSRDVVRSAAARAEPVTSAAIATSRTRTASRAVAQATSPLMAPDQLQMTSGEPVAGRTAHCSATSALPNTLMTPSVSSETVSSDVASQSAVGTARTRTSLSGKSHARRQRGAQWGKHKLDTQRRVAASSRVATVSSGGDVLKMFLKNAAQYKLLTADEEKELGSHVQQLEDLKRIAAELAETNGANPTPIEVAVKAGISGEEYESRHQVGELSKQRMVNSNLRMVVSIAKKFAHRGLPLEDLLAEGVNGLVKAVERFDPGRGFKFSTYSHWWIRQAVTRSIQDQARVIRLPVHLHDLISRIRKAELQLFTDHKRKATAEEVAEAVGITPARLALLNKAARIPTSTSAPAGGKDGDPQADTLEDMIEDSIAETVEDVAMRVLLKSDVNNVLHTLSPRECGVLRMRYGLDDGKERTLEEVGVRFKVTRERVRQIESKALRKMRQPSRMSVLEEYSDDMNDVALTARKAGGLARSG